MRWSVLCADVDVDCSSISIECCYSLISERLASQEIMLYFSVEKKTQNQSCSLALISWHVQSLDIWKLTTWHNRWTALRWSGCELRIDSSFPRIESTTILYPMRGHMLCSILFQFQTHTWDVTIISFFYQNMLWSSNNKLVYTTALILQFSFILRSSALTIHSAIRNEPKNIK